jgi:hypothetical protein
MLTFQGGHELQKVHSFEVRSRCRLPTLAAVPAEHPRRVQVRHGLREDLHETMGFFDEIRGFLLIFLPIHWQLDLLLNYLLVPQVQAMVDGLSKKYKFGSIFVRREPWWTVVLFETSESGDATAKPTIAQHRIFTNNCTRLTWVNGLKIGKVWSCYGDTSCSPLFVRKIVRYFNS